MIPAAFCCHLLAITAGESCFPAVFYFIKNPLKEVNTMTLNLIFITVTIKKGTKTIEECMNEERINKIIEQYKMKHTEIFTRVL